MGNLYSSSTPSFNSILEETILSSNQFNKIILPQPNYELSDIQYIENSNLNVKPCQICFQNIARRKSLPCEHEWICLNCCNHFEQFDIDQCKICNEIIQEII